MNRRHRTSLVLVGILLGVAACHDGPGSAQDPAQGSAPVCGLVSRALAAEVVGDGPVRTTGSGAVGADGAAEASSCTIRPEDSRSGPYVQVRIGPVDDPDVWRSRLTTEAEDLDYGTVAATYDGADGAGYGATYDRGIWVSGASANLVKGDRVVRVTVYRWRDASDEQRLSAARRIADDADANLTAASRDRD